MRSDVFTWVDNDYDGEISDYDEKSIEGDYSSSKGIEKDNEILEGGDDGTAQMDNVFNTLGENDLVGPRNDFDTLEEMILLHRGEELEGHLDRWKTMFMELVFLTN